MLYSTLLVAATAFATFAAAQNDTSNLPAGFPPCCTVPVNQVNSTFRDAWCKASINTCPEICGSQGDIAPQGNECDKETLEYTCKCKNGTEPNMANYEQTVPGQECRFWYGQCVEASGDDAGNRFACETARNERCGNLTAAGEDPSATTSGASTSRTPSSTDGGPSPTTSSGPAATSPGAAPLLIARDFGMPILAGALVAVFGMAL